MLWEKRPWLHFILLNDKEFRHWFINQWEFLPYFLFRVVFIIKQTSRNSFFLGSNWFESFMKLFFLFSFYFIFLFSVVFSSLSRPINILCRKMNVITNCSRGRMLFCHCQLLRLTVSLFVCRVSLRFFLGWVLFYEEKVFFYWC